VLRCCADSDCISPQTCTGAIAPQCHVVPGMAVPGEPGFECSSMLSPPGTPGDTTMCRSQETAIFPPGTACVVGVNNNLMVTDAFGFGNATGTGLFASGTGQSPTIIRCCGNGIVDVTGETCDTDAQATVPTI